MTLDPESVIRKVGKMGDRNSDGIECGIEF